MIKRFLRIMTKKQFDQSSSKSSEVLPTKKTWTGQISAENYGFKRSSMSYLTVTAISSIYTGSK